MKIKCGELILLWNALTEIVETGEGVPAFTAKAKRNLIKMRPEVTFWNDLTKEERRSISEKQINVDLVKIPADVWPMIPADTYGILKPIIEGKVKEQSPAMSKLLSDESKEVR